MAALVIIAFVVFGRPVGHYLGTAALVVAITVAIAAAALAAATAFAVFLSTRRRRALAGGCVGCTFRCQHAMTERPQRSWLVSTSDRTAAPGPVIPVRAASPARAAAVPTAATGTRHPAAASAAAATRHPAAASAATRHLIPAAKMPVSHPIPAARTAAEPDAPRWPDRPARRPLSTVGS